MLLNSGCQPDWVFWLLGYSFNRYLSESKNLDCLQRWPPTVLSIQHLVCPSSLPEMGSVSFPLESGLALWLSLTNRMQQMGHCASSGPNAKKPGSLSFILLESSHHTLGKLVYTNGKRETMWRRTELPGQWPTLLDKREWSCLELSSHSSAPKGEAEDCPSTHRITRKKKLLLF